jgi:citrate lyase subunit beta/citryl-CoA lyase
MTTALRSLLFVPGDSERKIAKGLASVADALILDLEDAVAPDRKPAARALCAEVLAQARRDATSKLLIVRINALDTPHALHDLAAMVRHAPFGIMVPKCSGATELEQIGYVLDGLEARDELPPGQTKLIPVATETAGAVLNLVGGIRLIHRLYGMLWGAEDLAADIGALANRDGQGRYTVPCILARTLCLLAASAAGAVPIDAVYTDFRDAAGLGAEAAAAARDGFTAKAAIHPDQIEVINAAFTPSTAESERARRILAAFAAAPDSGAVALDGRMLDRPHLRAAQRVIARSQPQI